VRKGRPLDEKEEVSYRVLFKEGRVPYLCKKKGDEPPVGKGGFMTDTNKKRRKEKLLSK